MKISDIKKIELDKNKKYIIFIPNSAGKKFIDDFNFMLRKTGTNGIIVLLDKKDIDKTKVIEK